MAFWQLLIESGLKLRYILCVPVCGAAESQIETADLEHIVFWAFIKITMPVFLAKPCAV